MTTTGWRNACVAFAALSALLAWRSCTRPTALAATVDAACAPPDADRPRDGERDHGDRPRLRHEAAGGDLPGDRAGDATPDDDEGPAWSVSAPAWVLWLAPQPGEDLLHYRDRMLPLAQAAIAPHRARVARGRDDFAAAAHLDDRQRAELDAAVAEAADTIQTRVLDSVLGGELMPARFKPMAGVTLGRDVLDAVDHASRRFQATLRDDQRATLARHPFDVADYLVFATRWEDALGATR